jgi:hypothetical protein
VALPPRLRRIFSPFTRPLSDFAWILYLSGIVAYCILYLSGIVAYRGEGLKLFNVVFFHHRFSKKRI